VLCGIFIWNSSYIKLLFIDIFSVKFTTNRIQISYLSNVCIVQDVIHFDYYSFSEDKWWFLSTVSVTQILSLKRHRRNLYYLRRTGVRTRYKSRWTDNEYLTWPIWMLSPAVMKLCRGSICVITASCHYLCPFLSPCTPCGPNILPTASR